jgi:hypothetical protein
MQTEFTEGLMDAYDSSVYLPSDKARPSPLLRENFHQTWQRWKAREAEEKALEAEKFKLEQQEQQRLYGGDGISDDVSLCPAMLGVVMSLFGDIDYIDP